MNKKIKLTNRPLKGYADWMPEEYLIRSYIFNTWRGVCEKFGYQEYLTPLLENADIYRAKSGDEVGGKELMVCVDRGGRELAVRPEMTPSVTRLVSRIYDQSSKPMRLFSIANFVRNQKPQKGRNREFWQLNFDIFGTDSTNADIEIIQMGIEIMLAFGAKAGSYICYVNSRKLIDFILAKLEVTLEEKITEVVRIMDKKEKYSEELFLAELVKCGLLPEDAQKLYSLMEMDELDDLKKIFPEIEDNKDFLNLRRILDRLLELGYGEYVKYSPSVVRGFDYYDGTIFEFFNLNGGRSIFGGGRYNGLAGIFGGTDFPAVGMAPGDETTRIFLEEWGLLPQLDFGKKALVTLFDEQSYTYAQRIAKKLRLEGYFAELFLECDTPLSKQLRYANKLGVDYVAIAGPDEQKQSSFKLKDMKSGEETEISL